MSMRAGQVARRAAAIIEERGWHQGGWEGENRAVCIRCAFNLVTWGIAAMPSSQEEEKFIAWMASLGVIPGGVTGSHDLADWNDDEDRTKDEILAYLNKFAEEHDPQPVLP